MKKINILFALFLVLSMGHLWAQPHSKARSQYKPAAVFHGDTAAYLEYNYSIRNVQYIGRTVGEILKELEFPVLYIVDIAFLHIPAQETKVSWVNLSVRQVGKKPDPWEDYYINVRFEHPPALDDFDRVSGRNRYNKYPVFTPELYDFIKDMKVAGVSSNEFIVKDPEILEKVKKRREEEAEMGRKAQEELERRRRSQ